MNENKNLDDQYFRIVSSFGKEVFDETLRDTTQKRQTALILSSVVTILISFSVITPVDGSIGSVKFLFTNSDLIPLLSGIICLYYLVIYVANVVRDMQYAEYRRLPLDIDMILLENSLEVQALKTELKIGELSQELGSLFEATGTKSEDRINRQKEISSQVKKISENSSKVFERSKYLYQSQRKFSFSKKISVAIEIVFPIVLSAFAIFSVVWMRFHK